MNWAAVWISLFAVWVSIPAHDAQDQTPEKEASNMKRLKDDLFKNYDKHVRPGIYHINTTTVTLGVYPLYVIDFDEEKSLFTLDTWLLMYWKDERLSWDKSAYQGLDVLRIGDDFVWQPDLTIYNSHSSNIDPKKNTHLLLYPDGHVFWVPPATITSFCAVNAVSNYPNDIQVCNITLGSWTHDGWQIDLQLYKDEIEFHDFYNTNPRWEVLKELSTISRQVMHYNCCEEPYVSVVAAFAMKRRFPSELRVIWEPIILAILLTLGMFWIPSDSEKKLILGAFLMLVLTPLLVYVATATKPPQAPRIAVSLIRSTMGAVASAILLQVFILNISRILTPFRPPETLVHFLSGTAGKVLCVFSPLESSRAADKIHPKENEDQPDSQLSPKDEWLLMSAALDRLFFLVYVIVLAAIISI